MTAFIPLFTESDADMIDAVIDAIDDPTQRNRAIFKYVTARVRACQPLPAAKFVLQPSSSVQSKLVACTNVGEHPVEITVDLLTPDNIADEVDYNWNPKPGSLSDLITKWAPEQEAASTLTPLKWAEQFNQLLESIRKNAPSCAEFWAYDENEQGYYYSAKPRICDDEWRDDIATTCTPHSDEKEKTHVAWHKGLFPNLTWRGSLLSLKKD